MTAGSHSRPRTTSSCDVTAVRLLPPPLLRKIMQLESSAFTAHRTASCNNVCNGIIQVRIKYNCWSSPDTYTKAHCTRNRNHKNYYHGDGYHGDVVTFQRANGKKNVPGMVEIVAMARVLRRYDSLESEHTHTYTHEYHILHTHHVNTNVL